MSQRTPDGDSNHIVLYRNREGALFSVETQIGNDEAGKVALEEEAHLLQRLPDG